ncbi:MAG: Adaptive-response sensory-kinase SasA [Syntrophus sp. SKADARSKE-3]|nr:Adaptive-response sensory-kinase SasA [Syntrophus sp. SKADARSKE-3]
MNLLAAFLLGVAFTAIICLGYAVWQRMENEQMMRSIIQGSPIPAFVIQKDHKVLYWNKSLEALSEVNAKKIIGTNLQWTAFYSAERPCMADLIIDETLESLAPNLYSGKFTKSRFLKEAYEATEFLPGLSSSGRWVRITAAAIRDSRGKISGAIETLEDITDRKLAEDALIRMKKLESLGTFASGVAEDFDSLLSAILRNIFLAKISVDDEDKILEEGLAIAEKAGLQAKELAHKLITFAKGGYPVLKPESLDQLLLDTLESVKHEGVTLETRIIAAPDLAAVSIDAKQIRQVFENILQNSLEAMPNGGVLSVSAECLTLADGSFNLKPGEYVKVSVKDSGCGISDEDLPMIFDPYFTTKRTGGRRGTGLGLAVSHSILKNHQGLIVIESEIGVGTTVHVYLPVKRADTSSLTAG